MDNKHSDEYKLLGLNIAYYRKANGLSQEKLSELVNISRTHMSRIETAECSVSLDVIFEICKALKSTYLDNESVSNKEMLGFAGGAVIAAPEKRSARTVL